MKQYMQIRLLENDGRGRPLSGQFSYFWGKWVVGFDDSQHCAKCLVGSYEKMINKELEGGDQLDLPCSQGAILYLCGVSRPYRYQNNFHLVLEACEGESVRKRLYNGMEFEVQGAKALSFDGAAAKRLFPAKGKSFLTCRNFQFAAQHFGKADEGPKSEQLLLFDR
jgi:hypothetical protein